MEYTVTHAETKKFATYYSVYSDANIFASFDWNERIQVASSNMNGYFIVNKDRIIGGFALLNNEVSNPFMVPPFYDKQLFWKYVFEYVMEVCTQNEIILKYISSENENILTDKFNAKLIYAQRRMFRPTEKLNPYLDHHFYFVSPTENDKEEIVQAVYEAHSTGFTSKIRKTDKLIIKEAINRRFALFSQTDSLSMSTLARCKESNILAGVCITGIYPDSPNNFSTIHQVSVRPQFRRQGIAEAMMLNSISIAHDVSPVITLGVMIGNPAEILYSKIGFAAGPRYSELSCSE